MKALLLAAGLGTRLKPITNNIPKCLVPINGKPLLAYWLEQLSKVGVTEFHINTHYFHEQVEDFLTPFKDKYNIVTHYEPQLLGTLKTFQALAPVLFDKTESIIVAHADNLVFCDWLDFLNSHQSADQDVVATMMTFTTDNPSSCGIVELNPRNRLIGFHEKVTNPPSKTASGAIYCVNSKVIDYWSYDVEATDISYHLIPLLLGKIQCWHNHEYLQDIGSPEALIKANNHVEQKGYGFIK